MPILYWKILHRTEQICCELGNIGNLTFFLFSPMYISVFDVMFYLQICVCIVFYILFVNSNNGLDLSTLIREVRVVWLYRG